MSDRRVRVRFAPSPTGALHMGGVRTALFNYLFAKKHGGDMLLRIEDTDQKRYVPGAEQYIMESLEWCGIQIDEGINEGGDFGPYRQSERKYIYLKYANQLIESGHAYYAFDTPEELEAMRERLQAQKSNVQQYNALTRGNMTNSLTLSSDEVAKRLEAGEAYVIRFKMALDEDIHVQDLIRGNVKMNSSQLDDKVLFKSDGMPTYHLANIVDDYLMKISHVIRGEEWLPSLPLHMLLYKAFGWEAEAPQFAHLPLLLKPNGKGKLSKRDGDKMGFPVFPPEWKDPKTGEISAGYREQGYFNEAFVNLIALLGWNSGTEQELFDMDELIQAFSIEKVGKSGAKFDPEKAKWFNQQYLREKSDEELAHRFIQELEIKGLEKVDFSYVMQIIPLVKDRVNFVQEFWDQTNYFFQAPTEYDAKTVKKRWKPGTGELLVPIKELLSSLTDFSSASTETAVKNYIESNELNMGQIMNALRLSLVGAPKGPHLFDIMQIIGQEQTVQRVERAIEIIQK